MSCSTSWLEINSQTPSDASSTNLSLLSSFILITSGSLVTPIDFEMLSPNDLLIASPCKSTWMLLYFGLEAKPALARSAARSHLEKHGPFLHSLWFFFSSYQLRAYDLAKDKSIPSSCDRLNSVFSTLSGENGSWVPHVGTNYFLRINEHPNKGWSAACDIDIWFCQSFLHLIENFWYGVLKIMALELCL